MQVILNSGSISILKKYIYILHLICKTLRSSCLNTAAMLHFCLVFVWLSSSVLFTWEINLRPCDGYYPPTDTWTNMHILHMHRAAGCACTQTNTEAYVCRHGAQTHTVCLCTHYIFAHSYWEPTVIFTHMSYKHYYAYALHKMCSHIYACYLVITVIINCTLAHAVKTKTS